jgi:HEAT repeat protein
MYVIKFAEKANSDNSMPTGKSHSPKQPNDPGNPPGSGRDVIAEIYKALKAGAFYPVNHPLRNDIIRQTYQFLLKSLQGKNLSLLITKSGLHPAEGGAAIENTLAAKSLAKELFVREIQRLSFLPDLSMGEFEYFLSLLTADPQKIIADGGMEKALADRGIRNIVTNEIDISAVFTKIAVSDNENGEPVRETGVIQESQARFDVLPADEMEDLEVEEIIEAMKREADDERYGKLAGLLLSKARTLKAQSGFKELLPIIRFLIEQSSDTSKSRARRDSARAAFEGAAEGEMTGYLLGCLADRHFKSKESVYQILALLGEKAVEPIIQSLTGSDNIHSRKALATALVRIGKSAVPAMLSLLKDHRWYVVRSMLAILGEIRCRECVRELRLTLFHEDVRVVKEAIRCLTKTGGPEAAEMLIELLADQNPSVKGQAIFSLGILKSERAVEPLMHIVNKRDIFLKTLQLKKEALQSIGLIGSKKALPRLMKMAGKGHLLAPRRRQELKIAAIRAIGRIGGDTSLDFLLAMAARGGPVGRACSEVIDSMDRKGNQHT